MITGIGDLGSNVPQSFRVADPYPNPFNSSTTIEYTLSEEGRVSIGIYGLLGNLVKSFQTEEKPLGKYLVRWNLDDNSGRKLASGVYFVRATNGRKTVVKKLLAIQ